MDSELIPPPDALHRGIAALLFELYELPSRDLGFERWGIKEVRFGLNEILTLRHFYPKAKFLYLYRDLEAAYASYVGFTKSEKFFSRWPHRMESTPYRFAAHRSKLLGDFRYLAGVGIGILIKYEDMVESSDILDQIENYLECVINRDVLAMRVGASENKPAPPWIERQLLSLGSKAGLAASQRITDSR